MDGPIVVVTGANGGVGFGICHRLLVQLSRKNPPDVEALLVSHRKTNGPSSSTAQLVSCEGLTIVMACRSMSRATAAREKLYALLDADIEKQRKQPDYDGHGDSFRRNVKIDCLCLDLAVMKSIFDFSHQLSQKYPYVSHLICNAGLASFSGIDVVACLKTLFFSPAGLGSDVSYKIQRVGELSVDGLGWVWQCNVFGHLALFRTIQPLLFASRSSFGSRVLWMSSLEATPGLHDPDDWQLVKTKSSYEASKYQIELIATHLDQVSLRAPPGSMQTRHLIVEPGVATTNMMAALVNVFTGLISPLVFYLCRLLGSRHFTITPYKAAISAIQLSLIPSLLISAFATQSLINTGNKSSTNNTSAGKTDARAWKFCSITDRWGNERVGAEEVREWEKNKDSGEKLVERCDALYQSLREADDRPSIKSGTF